MEKERRKYDYIKSKNFCQNVLQGKTHYKQNGKANVKLGEILVINDSCNI